MSRLKAAISPLALSTTTSTTPDKFVSLSNVTVAEIERQLTPLEAADYLRLSQSWLAKARMRGEGPPYAKVGRSIRYGENGLARWLETQRCRSTNDR